MSRAWISSRSKALGLSVALCASVLGSSTDVHAASPASPNAESLYQEGQRAAQARNWELACKLFGESHGLEPAPGTLLNLAVCEENLGALLAARAHFDAAARAFRPGDERITYANERISKLDARIPTLTIRLSPHAPKGTVVERDGLALSPAVLGATSSLDPGEHVIVVRVPGKTPERTTVRLVAQEARDVEVPSVSMLADTPARAGSVSSSDGSTVKIAGWSLLGAGAAGAALGTIGGLLTMNAVEDADANCTKACNPMGTAAQTRAKNWSAVSTVGFIAGGVGLAAGAGILLFVSKQSRIGARTSASGGELSWHGTF